MSQLAIGGVIYKLRKEKEITQEQLAKFMRVSTAAVSKWEKGNSYPDITLLPQLATFFQVSIDHLMNHNVELSDEEVMEIYRECEGNFNDGTEIEESIDWCRQWLNKYPTSYLLTFRLAFLLYIYAWKIGNEDRAEELIDEAILLFEDVANNSKRTELVEGAWFQLGALYAGKQKHEQAIEVLNKIPKSHIDADDLLPSIYIQQKEFKEARKILQTKLFKGIHNLSLVCMGLAHSYLHEEENIELAKRYVQLAIDIKHSVDTSMQQQLSMFNEYYRMAELYMKKGETERAIEMLEELVRHLERFDLNDSGGLANIWCFNEIEFTENRLTMNLYENVFLMLAEAQFDGIREDSRFQEILSHLKKIEERSLLNRAKGIVEK